MRWDDLEESRHVEDRRMRSGGGDRLSAGTLMMLWPLIRMLLRTKIGWVILGIGALAYLAGFNPLSLLGGGGSSASRHVPVAQEQGLAVRMKKVLGSTEQVWSSVLRQYGQRYDPPTLVLYRGATRSGCGYARAQVGPFYCPADKKIYLDLGFFEEMKRKLGAPGDFAQAYVLAHEVGHAVQDQLGILGKVHRLQRRALQRGDKTRANHLQIPVELQADCFAGVWGHYARKYLEPGDIEEAINAASKIGDDALQKQAQGYVVPDSFTHGTSRQRVAWFMRGFKSGDLKACDTFRQR
jgi:predicted metalloprotease